jgi:hypothetical protein
MNLGRYHIEAYSAEIDGKTFERQRITYFANNGVDFFSERYYGEVREGYVGQDFWFTDLVFDSIKTHIAGESVVINDANSVPLIYLSIYNIQSIQREGALRLIILDTQADPVKLEFISPYDSTQAYSRLNQLLQNPNTDMNDIGMDIIPPEILLNDTFYGIPIYQPGIMAAGAFTSNDSIVFSVSINQSQFSGPFPLSRTNILTGLVYDVIDNNDDGISLIEENIKIYKDMADASNLVESISQPGYYVVRINAVDLAGNENIINVSYIIS